MNMHAHGVQQFTCRRHLIWHCGIALLLSALSVASALACTPPPGGLPVFTIAQRVQAAEVVLQGTVTQLTAINVQNDTATITVQRYFKGSGPATVTITNFGPSSLCRSAVQVGDHWIFFAKGDPSALMTASYLGQFDAVAAPNADTIAQILAALNLRARAYLPLLVGSATNIAATPRAADDRALLGLALGVMGIVGVWLHFAVRWK
jgi:Agrin NtA domain